MQISKHPERIFVTKRIRDFINELDQSEYFGFKDISRTDLFLFAMALGVETNVRTSLENTDGLVRDSSLDYRIKALMDALFISNLKSDELLNTVIDKENVYELAQEYAHTGFQIIEDYFRNKKDSDLIWSMFRELDDQYKELFES